jgi:hypothetical protein
MTVRDDLIAAKALIDTPEKWTKGAFSNGKGCRCAMGAVMTVRGGDSYIARKPLAALRRQLPAEFIREDVFDVSSFNDDTATTHADIMALFDRAISKASTSIEEV